MKLKYIQNEVKIYTIKDTIRNILNYTPNLLVELESKVGGELPREFVDVPSL